MSQLYKRATSQTCTSDSIPAIKHHLQQARRASGQLGSLRSSSLVLDCSSTTKYSSNNYTYCSIIISKKYNVCHGNASSLPHTSTDTARLVCRIEVTTLEVTVISSQRRPALSHTTKKKCLGNFLQPRMLGFTLFPCQKPSLSLLGHTTEVMHF